eukprot:3136574-Pyramimonas_sp.AAC.1
MMKEGGGRTKGEGHDVSNLRFWPMRDVGNGHGAQGKHGHHGDMAVQADVFFFCFARPIMRERVCARAHPLDSSR